MKICHLITRMVVGGAQENTLFSCQGQIQKGCEVTLLTGEETGEEGNLLTEQVEGLKIIKTPYLKRNLSLINDLLAYKFLKNYFKKNKFDVVHTHSSKAGILGRIAAHKAGVKCVVHTIHGLPFHSYEKWHKNKLYIFAERLAAKYCHKIFSVADAMTRQALKEKVGTPDMYKTIRSGMDMSLYKSKLEDDFRKKLGIKKEQIVIGKIARLFELKGHDELIEIASKICSDRDDIIFLIVGDGILRSQLETKISSRGLSKFFIFTGLVSSTQIPDYIACMDIVIHLSLREGLPRVAVQALASCCPVIAYNLDGTPEVVKHNVTGLIYEPKQQELLINGLKKLIDNPSLCQQLGKNGQDRVLKQFSKETMVDELQKEYESILY